MRDSLAMHNPQYASVASPTDEQFSQASQRIYLVFTDQFGREWGADCERKTMHPCGPWNPRFSAPIYPPRQHVWVTDTLRMRCFVDLDGWLNDLREKHVDFKDLVVREAQNLFTNQAASAYRVNPDGTCEPTNPTLIGRVGGPPEPLEIVIAMQAKNRWMLGLKDERGNTPKRPNHPIIDRWFPEPVEVKLRDPFTDETLDPFATDPGEVKPTAADPFAPKEEGPKEEEGDFQPHPEYPFMSSPGRWDLTEADHRGRLSGALTAFSGSRADAEAELERREQLRSLQTHESWE